MYVTYFKLVGARYPLALGMIYGEISEYYHLPDLETLLASVKQDVAWPADRRYEVYFRENLRQETSVDSFEVCYAPQPDANDLVTILIDVEKSLITSLRFTFPGRSGRGGGSQIIGAVKSVVHRLEMSLSDLSFEVQGFPEGGGATYIKEHSLTAFVWVDGLKRYIHTKEDPNRFPDVRRGFRQL